jgi:signal transduction histidine kinase
VIDWIETNALLAAIILSAIAAAATIAFLVVFIANRLARRRRSAERAQLLDVERDRLALEVSLAEQSGRLRIIRELHEVSVHEMTVLISQADGARYAGAKDPKAAVRAAAVIGESARNHLANLRRVMSVVREGEAAVETQPELKSARDLLKVMRDAGLVITFEENGDRFEMKPGAELSVYRILEEALTNALRHGGEGTEVRIVFTWTDEAFQLVVDDDGIRSASRREGLDPNEISRQGGYELDDDLMALTGVVSGPGITEMRERAELFGGVFTANAVPGVGFSVSASFPALRYHNGIHGVNLDA